jgi:hypothetical protein
MYYRAALVWVLIAIVAVVNGAVREKLLNRWLGPRAGHVIATAVLSAVVLLFAWLTIGWLAPGSPGDALRLGVWWVVLTLGFEFLAGHYVFGNPWRHLLADYDVRRGRVWVVVLLAALLGPLLARQVHP